MEKLVNLSPDNVIREEDSRFFTGQSGGLHIGYLIGGVLVIRALLKPLHSGTAGVWVIPDVTDNFTLSLRLGFGGAPPGSTEILGWWVVPICILFSAADSPCCPLVSQAAVFGNITGSWDCLAAESDNQCSRRKHDERSA